MGTLFTAEMRLFPALIRKIKLTGAPAWHPPVKAPKPKL